MLCFSYFAVYFEIKEDNLPKNGAQNIKDKLITSESI
jgi:hypothetical protein